MLRNIVNGVDRVLAYVGLYRNVEVYKDVLDGELLEGLNRHSIFVTTVSEVFSHLNNQSLRLIGVTTDARVVVHATSEYTAARSGIYIPYAHVYGDTDVPVGAATFGLLHEYAHVHLEHMEEVWRHIPLPSNKWLFKQGDVTAAIRANMSEVSACRHRTEFEADQFAVDVMLRAGYDPEQISDSFLYFFTPEEMERSCMTHPSPTQRLASIRKRTSQCT